MGGFDLAAGGLVLPVQAQQQGSLVAVPWIPGVAGHHLVAASQGLRQLVQLHVPQAVIGLQAALRKLCLAAGLQQHAGREGQQDSGRSPGQLSVI